MVRAQIMSRRRMPSHLSMHESPALGQAPQKLQEVIQQVAQHCMSSARSRCTMLDLHVHEELIDTLPWRISPGHPWGMLFVGTTESCLTH